MSFHIHDRCSRSKPDDLEEGRTLVTAEGSRFFWAFYPYLFGRGLRASWRLLGCCTLVGLINIFSTIFTLEATMTLRTSDIVLESNAILVSTGFLVSLFWRLYGSRCQFRKESYRSNNELFSHAKLCITGCLFIVMVSPAVSCLPLLVIFWLLGGEKFSYGAPGMPLILCWVSVNTVAAFLVPSFILGREIYQQGNFVKGYVPPQEGGKDFNTYEKLDDTDGPMFLPQQPVSSYFNISEPFLGEGTKAAITYTPEISWKNSIGPSEASLGLVRWAVSAPTESLQPSMVAELLTIGAINIGVPLDGMDDWDRDTRYNYLVSRICDRLVEIFRQADSSAILNHAINVFLFVNQFEQFCEVDVKVLGSDSSNIPAEELRRVVRCLESRSTSSLVSRGAH